MRGKFLRQGGVGVMIIASTALTVCDLPVISDNYEPNDTYQEAYQIPFGEGEATIKATINPEEDEDHYLVNVEGEDQALLEYKLTVPALIQAAIDIYSGPDNLLDHKRADEAGQTIHDTLSMEPGEAVIRVRAVNYESSPTEYTLTLTKNLSTGQGY
ncbi:hypothetical protein JXM67_10425 [candidate division WOR-3 bacterium]|nr:hypothetical protein [candidate division WOR-3 bacterium]